MRAGLGCRLFFPCLLVGQVYRKAVGSSAAVSLFAIPALLALVWLTGGTTSAGWMATREWIFFYSVGSLSRWSSAFLQVPTSSATAESFTIGREENFPLNAKTQNRSATDGVDEQALREDFPYWVRRTFEALNHPLMALIVLLVGFTAAFVEVQSPGLGVPGFVALVSFSLFFWSTFLGGTATWLELVLFVLGIVCLIIEAYIPGFGIFGIGGWVAIVLALVLARANEQWPPTAETFRGVAEGAIVVCAGILGAFLVTIGMIALFGGQGAGGLVLTPPRENGDRSSSAATSYAGVRLGDIGVARTPLLLTGKAQFADKLVDVQSREVPVEVGSKVRVVEIRGHLIVVVPVDDSRQPKT